MTRPRPADDHGPCAGPREVREPFRDRGLDPVRSVAEVQEHYSIVCERVSEASDLVGARWSRAPGMLFSNHFDPAAIAEHRDGAAFHRRAVRFAALAEPKQFAQTKMFKK